MAKIRNDWPGLFSFNQNGLYRIFNEAQFIQQQLFLNSFQRASRFSNFSSFKVAKSFVDEWNRITPILVWSSDHVQISWLLNSVQQFFLLYLPADFYTRRNKVFITDFVQIKPSPVFFQFLGRRANFLLIET